MSLLALLAALLAQHARPVKGRQPLLAFYGRMCLSAAKRLNAGDRNSGILAWVALMARGAGSRGARHRARRRRSIRSCSGSLEVAFLYGTLRFLATTREPGGDRAALRDGDAAAAAIALGLWRGEPVETDDAGRDRAPRRRARRCARRTRARSRRSSGTWCCPGPLGLVLYPLALRAARSWEHLVEPEERDFGWFAARAFHVIDWIPQRVSAFVFAVAGNFEDALYCWRSQAAHWVRPEEGIVLASGAGALGVRSESRSAATARAPRLPGSRRARTRSRASRACCGARWSSG